MSQKISVVSIKILSFDLCVYIYFVLVGLLTNEAAKPSTSNAMTENKSKNLAGK